MCEVELVPKVSMDSVVSFSFINPKPLIYSNVYYDSSSTSDSIGNYDIEDHGVQRFDEIRIDTFLSTYGSYFVSTCRVTE